MNDLLRAKIKTGLIWSAIQNWSLRLSSLLVFMVLARVLTPEQIGLYAAAMVVLNLLGMLSEQGLGEAVVQRDNITSSQMNAVFWLNMSTSLVIVIIVWMSAPLISSSFNLPELTPIVRASSFTLPLYAATFGQMAMRRRTFGYKWIATAALIANLISSTLVLILVFSGFGVWSLVIQSLVSAAIVTSLMWIKPAWHLTREVDFKGIKPLMSYGLSRLSTYLLDFANTRYIEIFLAATLGPVALAAYTIGLKLHQALMQTLSSTILDVAHGGFSRLAGNRVGLVAAYYRSLTVTATLVVPVFCMIAAVAPFLTIVLFGDKWASSAEVMRWMALLGAVQVLQFYNGTVYNAIGRPNIGLQFMLVKVILTFGALSLVRDDGMTKLLHAYVFSQLITTPMSFYLLRKMIGLSLTKLLRNIWPMLCGSLLIIATAIATQSLLQPYSYNPFIILIASVSVGGIIYLGFIFLVARNVIGETLQLIRPSKVIVDTSHASSKY